MAPLQLSRGEFWKSLQTPSMNIGKLHVLCTDRPDTNGLEIDSGKAAMVPQHHHRLIVRLHAAINAPTSVYFNIPLSSCLNITSSPLKTRQPPC